MDAVKVDDVIIENLIYEVRGKQVMIDSDLAKLYECKNGTKTINLAVRRHLDRFPNDFYFQLTKEEYYNILRFQSEALEKEEYNNLKFQVETSRLQNNHGGVRKMPYVFTEQGVAMLATILRTSVASKMSVAIMRAFVVMRKYISTNLIEQKYINNQVMKNTEDIKLLQASFEKFEKKREVNTIFFDGQIYDAYSKIQDIFKRVNNKLIIVDSYADNTLLDIVKRLNVEVVIITKKNNLLTKQDLFKYNKQYHNLSVCYSDKFHDRYFVIDNEIVYHCGTSINRIGYRTFSINLVSDADVANMLIDNVECLIKLKDS